MYLDECSFQLNLKKRHGWCRKGERLSLKGDYHQSENVTLILCIDRSGIVQHKCFIGCVNAINFSEFLSTLTPGKYLVLDNLRSHNAAKCLTNLGLKTVKEITDEKRIELKFLPAYCPTLNPVEMCFNRIKSLVKKENPETTEDLMFYINSAVEKLNKNGYCRKTIRKILNSINSF
jgi:transposase